MHIQTAKLVYFSPTGTTKTIVEEIVGGIQPAEVIDMDYTRPETRTRQMPVFGDEELLILGSPVYGGRIPQEVSNYLATLQAEKTPTVLVVVYGNRKYEDALRELRDIAVDAGCVPIAAAAFIGEHSYSSELTPIAPGRPDAADKTEAQAFGGKILQKFQQFKPEAASLEVPGNLPYRERSAMPPLAPITDSALCTSCGKCAEICPMNAIAPENPTTTNAQRCILCSACIKSCPTQARSIRNEKLQAIVTRLHTHCQARKEPEMYL